MKIAWTVNVKRWFLRHKLLVSIIAIIIVAVIVAAISYISLRPHDTTQVLSPVAKQYQKELPDLKKKVSEKPNDAAAHKDYGVALYATGDLNAAKEQYQAATKLDSKDATAFNNLGNVYRDLGQLDQATTAYKTSITLNAKSVNTYANLANVQLYALNKPQDAITTYKNALKALPENSQLELLLGIAYEQAKDTPNAEATYQHILSYDKENAAAKTNLERLTK